MNPTTTSTNKPTLIVDIETNAIPKKTYTPPADYTVHCIAIADEADPTGSVTSYDTADPSQLTHALHRIATAGKLIGHNIIGFDLPILRAVYGVKPTGQIIDTLLLSRILHPHRLEQDLALQNSGAAASFPPNLKGSHSLEAWGHRLGILKGDYGKQGERAWQTYTPEMAAYCRQDIRVTRALYHTFLDQIAQSPRKPDYIALESDFARIIQLQTEQGIPFDIPAATALLRKLEKETSDLGATLGRIFPPEDKGHYFTPKRDNKTKGYKAGTPVWKEKLQPFNPNSRSEIAKRLKQRYHWIPEEYTATGAPKIDEKVLSALPYPEAPLLTEHLTLQKRLGQLSGGEESLLKLVTGDGRIHGKVNTCGTVTGRCTHSNPNLAQIPSLSVKWGADFRALFKAPPGYKMLGVDASGLELRCLAHYLAGYDGGDYAKIVLSGDVHWATVQALGLVPQGTERDKTNPAHESHRAIAKRFIYAFLYGAGDATLGALVLPEERRKKQLQKQGAALRQTFLANLPALSSLLDAIKNRLSDGKGRLWGLDGRPLHIRSEHSALNSLLQSAGSIIVKKATILAHQALQDLACQHQKQIHQIAHIHDEIQYIATDDAPFLDACATTATQAFTRAGEELGLKVRIDGEAKIGTTWKETH